MIIKKEDRNVCGIYIIRNINNNFVYVGSSTNIYNRMLQHIYYLRNKNKNENRLLIKDWYDFGENSFEYLIIEKLDKNDKNLLKNREGFWINCYMQTSKCYNFIINYSDTRIINNETKKIYSKIFKGENNPNYNHKWSKEQKENMSNIKKQQYKNGVVKYIPENTKKGIAIRNKKWKENPELKEIMKDKVRKAITRYKIYQYDKNTNKLIKVWDYINDIIKENPNYKKHNIYAVCSGENRSMYGYIWVKILNDDIVQTNEKSLE